MHTRETGIPSDSISGRRRYISSLRTLFVADTSSRGNASFLRSSESQEFDVVILLSWPRDPSRECERTGVAGCWWRVLRLPPTLSQVHIPDSRILHAKKLILAYQIYLYLLRRYSYPDDFSDFHVSRGVESTFGSSILSHCSYRFVRFYRISIL